MDGIVPTSPAPSHRVIPEMHPAAAKAHLRKADVSAADIGQCLDYARRDVGWTLDQLAGELGRDPRQVRRWIDGTERTQMDVVFGVLSLRPPFVIALASLAGCCELETVIRIRRVA